MKTYSGSSLVELCISIVLIAVITCIALPNFTDAIANAEGKQALINIMQLCNLAKTTAIKTHSTITVCPSKDQIHCNNNWHNPIMVFLDQQADYWRHQDEPLYAYTTALHGKGQLNLHIFPKNSYIAFNKLGSFSAHNGTLQYCPANGNAHISHALIISNTGKIRLSQDNDHDGIDENADNLPLSC